MKTFSELQIGDKIFIWNCQKKVLDIGIINNIIHKTAYIILSYRSTLENNYSFVLPLSLNYCTNAYTCHIRYGYSNCLISTYIDPILQLIEENEKVW